MAQEAERSRAAPTTPTKPAELKSGQSCSNFNVDEGSSNQNVSAELEICPPSPPRKPDHLRPPSKAKQSAKAVDESSATKSDPCRYTYRSPSFRNLNRSEASIGLSLFAHNLGYASAVVLVWFGIFGIIWSAENARIDPIIRPSAKEHLWGYAFAGPVCVVSGLLLFAFEYKLGLQNSKLLGEAQARSYLRPILYFVASICSFLSYATMLAGIILLICALVNLLACLRHENLGEKGVPGASYLLCNCKRTVDHGEDSSKAERSRVCTWLKRQREIGNVQQIVLVILYAGTNIALWVDAAVRWSETVWQAQQSPECLSAPHLCMSGYAPYAKAFGQTLNFNCACLLLPILRALLRKLNNLQSTVKWSSALLPPLRKNLIFHKFIALFVLGGAIGHIFFHYLNFAVSPEATLER